MPLRPTTPPAAAEGAGPAAATTAAPRRRIDPRGWSLRGRLVATLFVLTAVAMVVLAVVTYATQRSFLNDRLDDQTRTVLPAVGHAVGEDDDDRSSSKEPSEDGSEAAVVPGPGSALPPGAYVGQRRADGTWASYRQPLSYLGKRLPPPRLPSDLRPEQLLTVEAVGTDDVRYRVRTAVNPRRDALDVVALPLSEVDDSLSQLLLVEGLVLAATLALLTGLAWIVVRVGLRPLERMTDIAGAIAAGDLDRRVDVAAPGTEVGRLGLALNGMLGRLERAFAEREASEGRLRQFLSDASHELRTPLSSIRGYAELHRVGALREQADVERAMGRIEDEAARMGTLVEELLVLARLDETREKATADVDVSQLAEDAAHDAHAAAPDREIAADVDGQAIVHGDGDQLRQVLANLVRNALVHTPAGTPVEISSRRRGRWVEIEVRDHGPGLPDVDPEELFGRFWRKEAGRTRGPSGAGLGLAIVAAIVDAHDGEVEARDADGGGASFVVRLPLAKGAPPAPPA
ncbi:sensor histidine kinase [Patulibacter medicamentivorans]|uniref:histidine kinase n=1 Tax=Patulibacter medicamentivorans TaxID=1097667 RepID=H0E769_9ACTN|nr:HAMP domain-containing sensor histidine kinase [Patulibacter medicamentivorans]EHN10486.1 sensor histidine kinase [Patulibacter medicamentivorans]